jgi:hypothetical protein
MGNGILRRAGVHTVTTVVAFGLGVAGATVWMWQLWLSWDIPRGGATLLAMVVGALVLMGIALTFRMRWAPRPPTRVEERVLAVVFALPLGVE